MIKPRANTVRPYEGGISMGMSDAQWKSYLRYILRDLEELYAEHPSEKLKQMMDDIKKDLES
jgi:hypothetical protein